MTDEQEVQCEKDFGANMKILCKNGIFDASKEKKGVNSPIRLILGGGIYINRWKALTALANAMCKINQGGVKMVFDIYTNTELSEAVKAGLNDGVLV